MNKKRFWILALIFTLSLSLFACGDSAEKEEDPSMIADQTEKDDSEEVQEDDEEENTEEGEISNLSDDSNEIFEGKVNLYFANADYVNTGNEDLDKLLVEEKEIISNQEDLEMTLINELMEGPSDDSKYNLIPESVKIIDIENTDGTVYVNFSSENLTGGSIEEKFIVQQIVNTLLDLETSNEIVFLIDGEAAESLMGHIDITGGFTEKFE